MKLRAPAYPLITIDPYMSVWSMGDRLNAGTVRHWTGRDMPLDGLADIDGETYVFMGDAERLGLPGMEQTSVEVEAFATRYRFEAGGVELTAEFLSPVLPDDLQLLSRPVSYLRTAVRTTDGGAHRVAVTVRASEAFCLNEPGQCPVFAERADAAPGVTTMRLYGQEQAVLGKAGDDRRIDWGYFYLSVNGEREAGQMADPAGGNMRYVYVTAGLDTAGEAQALFTFAYDDVYSLTYFGKPLKSVWNQDGTTIGAAIARAYAEYVDVAERCRAFGETLTREAAQAGGEEYAELLLLALRQSIAAHKAAVDPEGKLLFVSKECFSNGCAATVDVSYPSIPLFLLYNTELVKGMMRPIFRYAAQERWPFDFAPHDVGTYPILNGQVYGGGTDPRWQMPVEECGNMLVMAAAVSAADGDADFAGEHRELLAKWAGYLLRHGVDPENQLCTDDFAGHLAHNCNLSLKAIMGLAGYARLCGMWGDRQEAARFDAAAREMAASWLDRAAEGDGSFRLAFDQPGTFSMKYNAVWDKLFGTGLFPAAAMEREFASYAARLNPYGMPLDNRADYTKSDWLVWTATLAPDKEQFMAFIHPLWLAYHVSPSRVPMTDWYSTVTSQQIGFQNRTVQGGLFIKLLEQKGLCRFKKIPAGDRPAGIFLP